MILILKYFTVKIIIIYSWGSCVNKNKNNKILCVLPQLRKKWNKYNKLLILTNYGEDTKNNRISFIGS